MSRVKPEVEKIYHIYNRGVERRTIFSDKWDYIRFLESMREFNSEKSEGGFYRKFLLKKHSTLGGSTSNLEVEPQDKPLVEFIAYCLLTNHYHFLIREVQENGIPRFMQKFSTGYTSYFNRKYKRTGSLFQGKYQIAFANSISRFLKLSVYVNCNAEVHQIAKAKNWPWSSYSDYIGERNGTMCNQSLILEEFGSSERFKSFCEEVLPDIIRDKEFAKSLIEI